MDVSSTTGSSALLENKLLKHTLTCLIYPLIMFNSLYKSLYTVLEMEMEMAVAEIIKSQFSNNLRL